MKVEFELRSITTEDVGFVFNAWLKSFKTGSYNAKRHLDKIYYDEHHKLIEDIIANPNTNIIIACNPEDTTQCYGFACGETITDSTGKQYLFLHYVYVKQFARNKKIGSQLIQALPGYDEQTPFFYTHNTYAWEEVVKKLKAKGVYNEYHLKKIRRVK